MEAAAFDEMFRLEREHWWFVGKRLLVDALMPGLDGARPRVLDFGCGTGGLLAHLARALEVARFGIRRLTYTTPWPCFPRS